MITVDEISWDEGRSQLLAVRHAVFVFEQGVPEDREVDDLDPVSTHFLARDLSGNPVGTARLLPDGRVGRVAVLFPWRRRGVGKALMLSAIGASRARGDRILRLHAQTHSIPFYESLGFVAFGEVFEEEGIPHREMELKLFES